MFQILSEFHLCMFLNNGYSASITLRSISGSIVFSPLNYWGGGLFDSQKHFWVVGIFLILREGESIWAGLAKIGCEGGDSTFSNWIVYLFFHFLNLARLYSCTILTVLSYVFIRIPDFGVGTTIMLSRRYLP